MAVAVFAFFLRLVRTFSLPGITTYSASKSLSKSMPILLLGRSFTWPSEKSTSYSLPRYLLIVFAFAGDSTITRDLDKLAPKLLSNQASKLQFDSLQKRFERCLSTRLAFFPLLPNLSLKSSTRIQADSQGPWQRVTDIPIRRRTSGNLYEPTEFSAIFASTFCDIRSDRNGTTSHLRS